MWFFFKELNKDVYVLFNGRDSVYRDTRSAFIIDAKTVSRVRHTRVLQKGRVLVNRHWAFRRHGLQRVHVDQPANLRQNVLAVGRHRQERPEMLTYPRYFVVSVRAGSPRALVTLQIRQGRPAFRFCAPQYQHTNHQKNFASAGVESWIAKLTTERRQVWLEKRPRL